MHVYTVPLLLLWSTLYVLIFSRSLRDEYLEAIWQNAMRSFGIIMFTIPWVWFIAWIIHGQFFTDEYWLLKNPKEFLFFFNGADQNNISQIQKSGVDFAFKVMLVYSPLVFVALFKWHAWRDRD
jgi:hypothetical protein